MVFEQALPFFHFYRGAEGRVEAFAASITKFKRLKVASAEFDKAAQYVVQAFDCFLLHQCPNYASGCNGLLAFHLPILNCFFLYFL